MYESVLSAQLKEILQVANTSLTGSDNCSAFFGFVAFVFAIVALVIG